VIKWHVVAMFAPGFFTGGLIRRFGMLRIMATGCLLMFGTMTIAHLGVTYWHFWGALVLLGIGWNFLYIGGTTLITEAYRPSEKAKAQGANDLTIFLVMATSSSASGILLNRNGWETLNYLAIPFIAAVAIALLWLMAKRRVPVAA